MIRSHRHRLTARPDSRVPQMSSKRPTLYLLDSFALIYQVFHAIPLMTGPVGQPTNAVFGILRDLLNLRRQRKPDLMAAAWDAPGPVFRSEIDPSYKATRKDQPEDLTPQLDVIARALEGFRVPVVAVPGFEADDVLATLARRGAAAGYDVILCTSDKDARQLLTDPAIRLLNLRKGQIIDAAAHRAEWGIGPERVVEALALTGDAVDNVPGVPGIGLKTAVKLLNEFGTLDQLLEAARAGRVPGKKGQALVEHAEALDRARRLIQLRDDLPLEFDPHALATRPPDVEALQTLCRQCGFHKFLPEIEADAARWGILPASSVAGPGPGQIPAPVPVPEPVSSIAPMPASPLQANDPLRSIDSHHNQPQQSFIPNTETTEIWPVWSATSAPSSVGNERPIWSTAEYRLVNHPEELAKVVAELAGASQLGLWTVPGSPDLHRAAWVGLALSSEPGRGWYFPFMGPPGATVIPAQTARDLLTPLLENPRIAWHAHDLKAHLRVLKRHGWTLAGKGVDPMVLSYLLESGERNHTAPELAKRFLNHTLSRPPEPNASATTTRSKPKANPKRGRSRSQADASEETNPDDETPDVVGLPQTTGTPPRDGFLVFADDPHQDGPAAVPPERLALWAVEWADASARLGQVLAQRVAAEGLERLYDTLERPLIEILADMEEAGVALDRARLRQLSRDFSARLTDLERQAHQLAGEPFNLSSPPQLRVILFERLGLPPRGKTPKGEASTAQEVLEELAALHQLPKVLLEHRRIEKLKNTYLDALPNLTHPDGRIRATFNQGVTATGRLSSSEPNLQNIPVRTEEGRQVRQAFVAGDPARQVLLTADYSQIELRVLAHFSRDPALLRAFEEDRDIHADVAAKIFGVALDSVTSDQRRMAKTVNFGVIYGLSAHGLASRLGISQSEAAAFINAYFDQYPHVEAFMTRVLTQARDTGRVETLEGRRRAINGIKHVEGRHRNLAERTAINTVIQGSAADLIKRAMIAVDQRLKETKLPARMILQIHDELLFEVERDALTETARLVQEAMIHAATLETPLKVDLAAGPNWLDVEPLEI